MTTETPDPDKTDAPVYDAVTGSVRPTDARYAGPNRAQLTPQELADIREAEIEANTKALEEQERKQREANDKALRDSQNSVLPTSQQIADPAAGDDTKTTGARARKSSDKA